MRKQKTLVNFILDKSGSMDNIRDATITGFNEYVNTLKKDKESDYDFTLTLFDIDVIRTETTPIAKVLALTPNLYHPDGGTALYDAVCGTVKGVKENKGQKVITIIMTDGEENSSREYTQAHMRNLIKNRENRGNWKFVYLGANQDSYKNAEKYGISRQSTSNFNATYRGMEAAFVGMACATMSYSATADDNSQAFLTKAQQEEFENTK